MIVTKDMNLVSGNTVLQPKYEPYEEPKKRKQKSGKSREKSLRHKLGVIRNILVCFIVGLILIGRYCVIYDMQRQLNAMQAKINDMNRENDNLKVELVKYDNLVNIEQTAINKLHMLPPDKSSAVYTDLSQKTIKTSAVKVQEEQQKNFWYKLRKILF